MLPIFLVVLLGYVLRRTGFLGALSLQDLGRLTYWVGTPSLLFVKTAEAATGWAAAATLFIVTAGATLVGLAAAIPVARTFGLTGPGAGTFVQATFRGNLAFVGLPLVFYAVPSTGAQARAVMVVGPLVVVYNVAAALVLLLARGTGPGRGMLARLLKGLIYNPLLLACAAGIGVAAAGWGLPVAISRTLGFVGQMALPLALLCVGASLVAVGLRGRIGAACGAAAMKVAALPAIGYVLALTLGAGPADTRVALLLLACPTAAASFILVRQLGGDEPLASGAILLSTAASTLALPLLLYLT